MIPGLDLRLAQLAAHNQTATYGQLARDLGLTGAATIARLTEALEALMDEDAKLNLPFRAALLSGRLNQNLPAQGFFDKARALGRYTGEEPNGYVADERASLHALSFPKKTA